MAIAMSRAVFVLTLLILSLGSATAEAVRIKWNGDYPHNNDRVWSKEYELGWSKNFLNGTPQEGGKVQKDGFLTGEITRPKTPGPHPFVILMHGCGGMDRNAKAWVAEYSAHFSKLGYATLALDSFTTRHVKGVCNYTNHWARRRSEDAYSALAFLAEKGEIGAPGPAQKPVYVMGRSNGGTATIFALESVMAKHHAYRFAGGFALVPGCKGKATATFYSPLYIFAAGQDDSALPQFCQELAEHKRPAEHPTVRATIYNSAFHGYMDHQPLHVFNGWRMVYSKEAADHTLLSIELILKGNAPRSGVEFK